MVYTASLVYAQVLTEENFVKVISVHIQLVQVASIGFCSMTDVQKSSQSKRLTSRSTKLNLEAYQADLVTVSDKSHGLVSSCDGDDVRNYAPFTRLYHVILSIAGHFTLCTFL